MKVPKCPEKQMAYSQQLQTYKGTLMAVKFYKIAGSETRIHTTLDTSPLQDTIYTQFHT